MTNEKTFKASNGLVISEIDEGDYMVTSPSGVEINVDPWQSFALREFFQYERDQGLGRARWPENPDYVIYREPEYDYAEDGRCVRILHEPSANVGREWERWSKEPSCVSEVAAHWYFTEGPGKEPERPWEQAQPGEVWRLTVEGKEQNAVADSSAAGNVWFNTRDNYIRAANPDITAGRKLVNADGSLADE